MHDLDTVLLRAFVVIAECGSTRRCPAAGTDSSRRQHAVGAGWRTMSAQAFNRSTRAWTEAGHVRFMSQDARLSEGARRALAGQALQGPIRFGMIEDIAVGSLPRALQRFAECHPNVGLELTVTEHRVVGEAVAGSARCRDRRSGLIRGEPILTWRLLRWVAARLRAPGGRAFAAVTFDGVCTWREKMIEALKGGDRPGARC